MTPGADGFSHAENNFLISHIRVADDGDRLSGASHNDTPGAMDFRTGESIGIAGARRDRRLDC
jgi:hypothetical protein